MSKKSKQMFTDKKEMILQTDFIVKFLCLIPDYWHLNLHVAFCLQGYMFC